MKFQLSPTERTALIAYELIQAHSDGEAGLTSHDLAQRIGVTPRTIRDNIAKWGGYHGIDATTVQHRAGVDKYVYRVAFSTDSLAWGRAQRQGARVGFLRKMGHEVR